jgi:hypothetical protein
MLPSAQCFQGDVSLQLPRKFSYGLTPVCWLQRLMPNHTAYSLYIYIYIYIYIYMLKFHIIYIWCCLYRQIQRTLLFYIHGKILCLSSSRPINNTEKAQIRAMWLLIWWSLETYMVVNFRARGISRGTRKLARIPALN